MRTWLYLLVAMSAAAASGCKRNDDVKFVRDAPTAIPAGQTYEYVFRVTRPVDKAFFISCDSRDEPKVDRDNGKVTFVRSDPTEVKLCVEYHMTDGPSLDKYEVTVKVGERIAVGTEGFPKPIQKVHGELKAALGAVEARASAAPATCPKLGGYAHVYQVNWLEQFVATPTKPFTGDVLFSPPSQMYHLLTEPESTYPVRELTERTHAVIVKQEKVLLPKYAKGPGLFEPSAFEGGAFKGTAYVVDLAAAKPVCRIPLAFESSEKITFFQGKDEGPVEPKRVVMLANRDLDANGRKALEAALLKAGTDLKPAF